MSVRVEPEAFRDRVATALGDMATSTEVRYGQTWLTVDKNNLVNVARKLKDDPGLACDYLTFLSAVDWQTEGFEVIVVLFSTLHQATTGIKVAIGQGTPAVPSLTDVFRGANWHERECAEMFGINFDGHPDLRPLYLPEDFVGHPLRKDFQLASRAYKPWPGEREPGGAEGSE